MHCPGPPSPLPRGLGGAAWGESAAQTPVTFDDIAVHFSADEWAYLEGWQKDLHRNVMKDNLELLKSVGIAPLKMIQEQDFGGLNGIINVNKLLGETLNINRRGPGRPRRSQHPGDPAGAQPKVQKRLPRPDPKDESIRCPYCGVGFNSKARLIRHQLVHSDVRPFICEVCSRTFNRKCHLISHLRTHQTERPIRHWRPRGSTSGTPNATKSIAKEVVIPEEKQNGGEPLIGAEAMLPDGPCPGAGEPNNIHCVTEENVGPKEKPAGCETQVVSETVLPTGPSFVGIGPLTSSAKASGEEELEKVGCRNGILNVEKLREMLNPGKRLPGRPRRLQSSERFPGMLPIVAKHRLSPYTKDESSPCLICGTGCTCKASLMQRQMALSDKHLFTCQFCGRTFNRKCHLMNHLRTHLTEPPITCVSTSEDLDTIEAVTLKVVSPKEEPIGRKPWITAETMLPNGPRSAAGNPSTLEAVTIKMICRKEEPVHGIRSAEMIQDRLSTDACGEQDLAKVGCDSGDTNVETLGEALNTGKRRRGRPRRSQHPPEKLPKVLKRRLSLGPKDEPFLCPDCGVGFNCRANLKRHQFVHLGVHPFSCEVCGRTFRRKAQLVSHQRTHQIGRPIRHWRPRVFTSAGEQNTVRSVIVKEEAIDRVAELQLPNDPCSEPADLNIITIKVVSPKEEPIEWETQVAAEPMLPNRPCSGFGPLNAIQEQWSTEPSRERGLEKDGLDSGALNMETLMDETLKAGKRRRGRPRRSQHPGPLPTTPVKVHKHFQSLGPKEDSVLCPECGVGFSCKAHLMRHQIVHSGFRPFTCEVCSRTFSRKAHLISHQPTHRSDRPIRHWGPRASTSGDLGTIQSITIKEVILKEETISCESWHVADARLHTGTDADGEANSIQSMTIKVVPKEEPIVCEPEVVPEPMLPNGSCSGGSRTMNGSNEDTIPSVARDAENVALGKEDFNSTLWPNGDYDIKAIIKLEETYPGDNPGPREVCPDKRTDHKKCPDAANSPSEKEMFSCRQCSFVVNNKILLMRHQKTHFGTRPFACDGCNRSFNRKSHLISHQRIHGGERPHQCPQCGKCFHFKHHLMGHLRIHTGEKMYSCSDCPLKFNHKGNYETHRRLHTGERPYVCIECEKSFNRKADLLIHERTHTGEKPFACKECSKGFSRRQHLINHMRHHTGEAPFACAECQKTFTQKKALMRHQQLHSDNKPYVCEDCGKAFVYKQHLLTHQRAHQQTYPRKYQRTPREMNSGEKPIFTCTECSKTFPGMPQLVIHQRMHTGERPFPCSVCGKGFHSRQYLLRHEKIHSGKRPYRCEECGDSFIQKPNLERHKGIHTAQGPYCCLVCGGRFFKKHNLVRHQRIHTGERLHFSCKTTQKNAALTVTAPGLLKVPGHITQGPGKACGVVCLPCQPVDFGS